MSEERTDQINEKLTLIRRTDGLTFGTDAYLLYAYLPKKRWKRAVDLGAGTGVISLLALTGGRAEKVYGVEVQEAFADLIGKNARLNALEDRLIPLCRDVRDLTPSDTAGECDLVFSNPPYLRGECGYQNRSDAMNIARREVFGTIWDFCSAAARVLSYKGTFCLVYRADRMVDLLSAMRRAGIEPKRLTPVQPTSDSPPGLVLCEGRKGGAPGLFYTKPLILYRDTGQNPPLYTEELTAIYEKGEFDESYRNP